MNELELSEIWIYPIKSLGGIRVQKARALQKGLEYDRRWMLVDENGKFMTQRLHPTLALFKLKIENEELIVFNIKTKESHSISVKPKKTLDEEVVIIWDDTVRGYEVSKVTSSWFSNHLSTLCRLIFFPEENERAVDPNFSINNEHVSLADGYPFMIIGQSSVDFLNTKLQTPLPMNRFRPNFVFTGGKPNEEDLWKNISIGLNRFVSVKPCIRCVLTTVNQDTAEKGIEPLRTLATYRQKENKILFGQNLIAVDNLFVKEGDLITIETQLLS